MNLKSLLKSIKLHESTISMVLGAVVIVVLGVIVVNYFRDLEKGEVVPPTVTEEEKPKVVRGEGAVTYTVSEGESLWSIAEKQYGSGYNWVDIAEENDLENANLLVVGQEIVIPDVEPRQPTVTEDILTDKVTEPISGATYIVERGDTLWDITVRAYGDGYRWVDIARENNLANPHLIHRGNILVLPR